MTVGRSGRRDVILVVFDTAQAGQVRLLWCDAQPNSDR